MNKEQEERAKQLAREHWEYLCKVLDTHGVSPDVIRIVGFHYKSAAIHFYKHGIEDCEHKMLSDEYLDKLMNGKVGGNE